MFLDKAAECLEDDILLVALLIEPAVYCVIHLVSIFAIILYDVVDCLKLGV